MGMCSILSRVTDLNILEYLNFDSWGGSLEQVVCVLETQRPENPSVNDYLLKHNGIIKTNIVFVCVCVCVYIYIYIYIYIYNVDVSIPAH